MAMDAHERKREYVARECIGESTRQVANAISGFRGTVETRNHDPRVRVEVLGVLA